MEKERHEKVLRQKELDMSEDGAGTVTEQTEGQAVSGPDHLGPGVPSVPASSERVWMEGETRFSFLCSLTTWPQWGQGRSSCSSGRRSQLPCGADWRDNSSFLPATDSNAEPMAGRSSIHLGEMWLSGG
jgi:hypothetical protein